MEELKEDMSEKEMREPGGLKKKWENGALLLRHWMGWITDIEATLETARDQVNTAENITGDVVDRLQEVTQGQKL